MKIGKICNGMNKVYLLFICFIYFIYFFLFRDFIEKQVSILGYVDELIAFMAIPIFFSKLYKNKGKLYVNKNLGKGYNWYILVFLISGLLGNFIYQYQPFVQAVLPDVFLCLKFWLSIAVGKYIFQKLDIAKYAKKIYKHIKMITWFYTILIVIDNIYPIFISDIRYGMRSTQLFYSHPTVFGACCVLMVIILLIIQRYVEEKDKRKYFIWLSVLICSTLRSKMFGCVMAFWLIYYFVFYRKKKFQLRTIVMFVPLVVLLGWSQIEYYFFSEIQEGSARYQLLVKSFQIAKEHFPIGAGFATFGSHYSAVVYSPLYRKYGI